jgi:hypothetical protein
MGSNHSVEQVSGGFMMTMLGSVLMFVPGAQIIGGPLIGAGTSTLFGKSPGVSIGVSYSDDNNGIVPYIAPIGHEQHIIIQQREYITQLRTITPDSFAHRIHNNYEYDGMHLQPYCKHIRTIYRLAQTQPQHKRISRIVLHTGALHCSILRHRIAISSDSYMRKLLDSTDNMPTYGKSIIQVIASGIAMISHIAEQLTCLDVQHYNDAIDRDLHESYNMLKQGVRMYILRSIIENKQRYPHADKRKRDHIDNIRTQLANNTGEIYNVIKLLTELQHMD